MSPAQLDPKLRRGVGASEVAMLFGCSPYGNALDLYCRIVHPEQSTTSGPKMRGSFAERFLAAAYAHHNGLVEMPSVDAAAKLPGRFLCDVETQRHVTHDFIIASPDRVVIDHGLLTRVVEFKTDGDERRWPDPDEVKDGAAPAHHLLQVAQQMLVGVDVLGERQYPTAGVIVGCVGGLDDYREVPVPRDDAVERAIVVRLGSFWRDHVLPKIPPDLDGSPGGETLLRAMFPYNRVARMHDIAEPGSAAHDLAARLARASRAKVLADHACELARQQMMAEIGDRAGFEGEGFKVSWLANRAGARHLKYAFDDTFPGDEP